MAERVVTEAELVFKGLDKSSRALAAIDKQLDQIRKKAGNIPFGLGGRGGLGRSAGVPGRGGGGTAKPPQLGNFEKVVQDLSNNTLRDFANATGLSATTLSGLSSSAGIATSSLAAIGPVVGVATAGVATLAAGVVALGAGLTFAGSKAVDFQSDLQGIVKTTGLPAQETRELKTALLELSQVPSIGQSAKGLAEISQVAGTLGIKGSEDLGTFTETMARLVSTSNIVGQSGTEEFGKLLAVTDTSISKSANLASAITVLAASYATTEAKILSTGQEVAKAGISFNLAADDALAMAAVLDSFGIEAELSRSTVLRLGQTIQSAVLSGGQDLERLAAIAGVSSSKFAETFRHDAGDAITLLLRGFKTLKEGGGDLSGVLDGLGLKGVRLGAVIPTLATRVDELARAMQMASDESADPSRLFDESARMADTVRRNFETLKNEVIALAIESGDKLLPGLDSLIDSFSELVALYSDSAKWIAEGGASILSTLADIIHNFGETIRLAKDAAQFGLFDAFIGGEGDTQRAVAESTEFLAIVEKINKVAQEGTLGEMEKAYAKVQSQMGASRAEAKLLQGKIEDLEAQTRIAGGATDEQREKLEKLRAKYVEAAGDAGRYMMATRELKEEMDFLTRIKMAGAAEVSRLAAIEKKEAEARIAAAEAAKKYEDNLDRLAKTLTSKLRTPTEKLQQEQREVNELFATGRITSEQYGRALEDIAERQAKLSETDFSKSWDKLGERLSIVEHANELMSEFGIESSLAMKAAELLAKEGINKEAKEIVDLLKVLEDATDKTKDLTKAQSGLAKVIREIESIERVTSFITEFGVSSETASKAVSLMESAGVSATEALSLIARQRDALAAQEFAEFGFGPSPEDIERMGKGLELWDFSKSRVQAYHEEVAKIDKALEQGMSQENYDRIKDNLDSQLEGWERIGIKAIEVGEKIGGVWGRVFAKLGENMGRIDTALGGMAQIAAARGDTGNAQWLGAAQQAAQGNWGGAFAGAIGASGAGQPAISQFDGKGEGNFKKAGAELGNAIWPGWGAVIGAFVGAFIKSGADDFHSSTVEMEGKAQLKITQAEGELGKIGEKIAATVEGFLNNIQDSLLPDLDLSGLEIHIREDRVRVVHNGMERVFNSLEEAMDFGLRRVLAFNAGMQGLGDEVRNMFEAAGNLSKSQLGNPEKLAEAFELANQLDFEQTGVDQEAIRAMQRKVELGKEFNLSLDKILAMRRKEIDATIAQTRAAAHGVLGATDFTSRILALSEQMTVANNTTAKMEEIDRARIEQLKELIAQQSQENVVLKETHDQSREGVAGLTDVSRLGREAIGEYRDEILANARALGDGKRTLQDYQRELDALTKSLEEGQQGFQEAEFAALWERTINDASLSLISMIQAVEGPTAKIEEQRRLQNANFILQLGAQIQQAKIVYETMQFVTEASRALFAGLIEESEALLGDLLSGDKSLQFGGGAGKGRREEQKREAEEAAQRLADFTTELQRIRLNSQTASRSLGDFANRLADIGREVAQAIADGASAEVIREYQRLQFRSLREEITDPFTSAGRGGFAQDSISIEQQRRDALERARLLAEQQSEALGVPFELVFGKMEEEINQGAQRMQNALVRGVIDSFNLPLENVRKGNQEFSAQMRDLDQAYARGEISGRRYRMLIDQIREAQSQALGSDVLGLLDKYYTDVAGREQFRQHQEMATFELELASARLRFNNLVAENALSEEAMARIGGFIQFMEENPPDWESYFGGPERDLNRSVSSFSSSMNQAVTSVSVGFDSLIDSIRQFIAGFERIGLGPLTQMAQDFNSQIGSFQEDFAQELSKVVEGYTVKGRMNKITQTVFGKMFDDLDAAELLQLSEMDLSVFPSFRDGMEDMAEAALALQQVESMRPRAIENLLSAYRGEQQFDSQLEAEFHRVQEEFRDAVQGLEMLGASAMELAEAEAIHQQRLQEFWESALEGIREVGEDIRRGEFGGVSARDQLRLARENFEELRARAQSGDLSAVEQLGQAMRDLISAEELFTGGAGPEMNRLLDELANLSDTFDLSADTLPPPITMDPQVVTEMTLQTGFLETSNNLIAAQSGVMQGIQTGINDQNTMFAQSQESESTFRTRQEALNAQLITRVDSLTAAVVGLAGINRSGFDDSKQVLSAIESNTRQETTYGNFGSE